MSDIQYNLQFKKLCNTLKLGEIVGKPKAISGGFYIECMLLKLQKGNILEKAGMKEINRDQNLIYLELIKGVK